MVGPLVRLVYVIRITYTGAGHWCGHLRALHSPAESRASR